MFYHSNQTQIRVGSNCVTSPKVVKASTVTVRGSFKRCFTGSFEGNIAGVFDDSLAGNLAGGSAAVWQQLGDNLSTVWRQFGGSLAAVWW